MDEKLKNQVKYKLIGNMRRLFSYSDLAKEVRADALSDKKGVRGGKMYTCNVCGEAHPTNKTFIDHIDPVVPIGMTYKDITLEEYMENMWCDKSNLQLICKDCHHEKSQAENKERRANKGKKIETKKVNTEQKIDKDTKAKKIKKLF